MLRTTKKRTRKKYNTVNGGEPRTKKRVSHRVCEICRREPATMTCEICGKHVGSGCCDVSMGNPDDIDTYVLMCDDCMSNPDELEYVVLQTSEEF